MKNHQLIDYFPIPAFLVEKGSYIIKAVNQKAILLTGLKAEELAGRKMTDFVIMKEYIPGEYEHFRFKLDDLVSISGTLSIQSLPDKLNLITFRGGNILGELGKKIGSPTVSFEHDELYRALIDTSVDSVFIMQKGIIRYANHQLVKISGFSLEELTGRKFIDFVAPSEVKKVHSIFYRRKRGETTPMIYESAAQIRDGSLIDVEVNVVDIIYEGQASHQVVLRDISKRKKAERKYQNIIDFAPIGFYQTSRDGSILLANKEFGRILGYSDVKELITCNIKDFYFNPDDREVLIRKYDTINRSEVKNAEVRFRKKDGQPIWVLMTSQAIKDENHQTLNYDGFIMDITDRKIYEQEISRLYQAIDQSPSPVALTDLDGYIIYVNPRYCELSGYKWEELIGSHTRIFKSGKQSAEFYKDLWDTIIRGETWNGEIINRKKNGDLFLESVKISPVYNQDGEPTHYIKVSRDITQERKIQDDLIFAKEKAEESDRLKSAFLANMSHEIRTPMNGILGFTNLLLKPNLNDAQKDEYIRIIHQSGQRMLNTVNDIIEISKIEAGIVHVSKTTTNLNESIKNIIKFFKPECARKGLSLELEKELPENYAVVVTDVRKFESVFINLVKNAVKFTDKGSILIHFKLKNDFIEFCVSDTGIGIPKNRITAIFNRFEQADIADTRAFEGSGLGLAISKSYIEMLGGKIWVDSVEGRGSDFYFTLPLIHGGKSEQDILFPESGVNLNKDLKNMKVLLVEDDEISAVYMKMLLEDIVKEIHHVRTGEEAVRVSKPEDGMDIIFMDMKLPGIDGYETTRQIRLINKGIIIIAQTAYAMTGDREKAIDAGCNDYLSKPIRKDEILAKLKN